ncbi:MAG: hypothetical protein Crog3KO_12130 [Crocinitomicaceae bacterium]
MKNHFSIFSVLFLLLVFSVAPVRAQEEEPMKFLFIGNSYTYMNDMPGLFEKMAKKSGKNVLVEKNTKGGASFQSHTGRDDMFEAIRKRKWDYVVLQGFSREMSFQPNHIDSASVPYIQQILDSIYYNNACTHVRFYMTWGYDDGFKEREEVDTYDKMADSIRKGYEWIGSKFGLPVVPAGMVWREVRNNKGIDLYYKDRAHPNLSGSYTIAATFFSAFFDEPLRDNYIPRMKNRYARKINKVAFNYVAEHRAKYHLDDYLFHFEVEKKRDLYEVKYKSLYPDASLQWYVNDSLVSSDDTGTIYLQDIEDKQLTLKVTRACGSREYKRILWNYNKKAIRRRED